ncbi:putative hemicentin-2 [Apostichopus japonicus]|uniref:Putative hemicentin-2 n=1 Tax=Stichopus japonicus TaxID=307972 RepID=A0A2G8JFL1_STIJA|nr:putative hemicentin-2 [Apostichopus japonicus]
MADTVTTNALIIYNAREIDGGLFTCASYDMPGMASVHVTIHAEPNLEPMADFILTDGEGFVLTCLVVPPIPSGNMYWNKNGILIGTTGLHDIDGDRSPDGEILTNGSLVIYEADKNDAGIYTCLLRYVVNRRSETILRNINVNVAVEVTVKEYIKLGSPLYQPIQIACTAYGFPVPEVAWMSKNFTLGSDGYWGRDISVTTQTHSPISVTSTITIGDLPGTFAMASVTCDANNFFSNASQLSLIIKFGTITD